VPDRHGTSTTGGTEGGGGDDPTPARASLDTLLTVEGLLGAAVFDAVGRVEATVNFRASDAAVLFGLLSSAIGGARRGTDQAPAFAAFTLSEGQIAVGSDDRRAIVALTDPGLDTRALRELLTDALAALVSDPPAAAGTTAPA